MRRIATNLEHLVLLSQLSPFRGFHATEVLCGYRLKENLKDCYSVLRVAEHCEDEEIREAYLKLAKEYHPDSGSKLADSRKFAQIDEAYRAIINHRQRAVSQEEDKAENERDFNIRHTAPQHRQYLNYESVGFGTPSQREKQYRQFQAQRAVENVYEYRTGKIVGQFETSLVTKDKRDTRKKIIRNAMERLVEDLIADSIAKGEFDNLAGSGKPLTHDTYNPLVDVTTHNLNKVLIQNGYAPDVDVELAKKRLMEDRVRLGPEPLSSKAKTVWKKSVQEFEDGFRAVNTKINKLNMLTPSIHQQIIPYSDKHVQKEIKTVLEVYKFKVARGDLDARDAPKEVNYVYTVPAASAQRITVRDVWNDIKALFTSKIT